MKYAIWISVLLTFVLFSHAENENEGMVEAEHRIHKRSCFYYGEECTKDVECCTLQCLCSTNDCKCGKRKRPSELKKYFTKRTCGL